MIRLGMAAGVVVAGCIVAGLPAMAAGDCIDSKAVIEKMNSQSDFVEKLDGKTVENLKAAFAEQYKHPLGDADQALVFHRRDTPSIDYLVLLKDGCVTIADLVEEDLVRKAVLKSHPPADSK